MIKAIDGTSIDEERLETAEKKIELYKQTKEGNFFDTFYMSDLAVFETGIDMMRTALKGECATVCDVSFPNGLDMAMQRGIETMIKQLKDVEYSHNTWNGSYNIRCNRHAVVDMFKSFAEQDLIELTIDGHLYKG